MEDDTRGRSHSRHPSHRTGRPAGCPACLDGRSLRWSTLPIRLLMALTAVENPENPEDRSHVFGGYSHRHLVVESRGATRFRFLLEPTTPQATTIELTDVDLGHFVATVPHWIKADPDLTKVGLIDRESNHQQIWYPE